MRLGIRNVEVYGVTVTYIIQILAVNVKAASLQLFHQFLVFEYREGVVLVRF